MLRQILRIGTLALLLLALVAPARAEGAGEHAIFTGSREVRLADGTVFDGKPLPTRVYHVQWATNGDLERVQVQLSSGHHRVATAMAQLIELPDASPYDSVVLSRNRAGELELVEIRFAGKKSAIALFDATGSVARNR